MHLKINGTETMRMHIDSYCKKSPLSNTNKKDASQQKLVFKNSDFVGNNIDTSNPSLKLLA